VQRDQDWFVGVPTGIMRLHDENGDGREDLRTVLIDDYPTSGHSTRTVLFLADGRMVVSIGSSCNVCEESDPRRAAIVVYDGSQADHERLFATGLRNAVGLALHTDTGQLWATNNGRDLMGDDRPPDTIERIQEGGDHGWPGCHSGRIIDPRFGHPDSCQGVRPPALELQAHSAPLGLVFYDAEQFPAKFSGDLFVAYHGSWNRSTPTGYKIVRVHFRSGQPTGLVEDFATGWLDPDSFDVSGRPVGLEVGPDGALYVSDDTGGFIYRIAYRPG
jgi:glucose/arabinose dehydrogenase